MTKSWRYLLYLLIFDIAMVAAKTVRKVIPKNVTRKQETCKNIWIVLRCLNGLIIKLGLSSIDIFLGVGLFIALLILAYILKKICPNGPQFTSLELDEIRIERLDDIESSIVRKIDGLKVIYKRSCLYLLELRSIYNLEQIGLSSNEKGQYWNQERPHFNDHWKIWKYGDSKA